MHSPVKSTVEHIHHKSATGRCKGLHVSCLTRCLKVWRLFCFQRSVVFSLSTKGLQAFVLNSGYHAHFSWHFHIYSSNTFNLCMFNCICCFNCLHAQSSWPVVVFHLAYLKYVWYKSVLAQVCSTLLPLHLDNKRCSKITDESKQQVPKIFFMSAAPPDNVLFKYVRNCWQWR